MTVRRRSGDRPRLCRIARWHGRSPSAGFTVLGFDLDPAKVARLNAAILYPSYQQERALQALREAGRLAATGEVRGSARPTRSCCACRRR